MKILNENMTGYLTRFDLVKKAIDEISKGKDGVIVTEDFVRAAIFHDIEIHRNGQIEKMNFHPKGLGLYSVERKGGLLLNSIVH